MFDFDAGKLVLFGIIALAVIPPKDLPRVLRTVGKYVGQMRRMASDFQGQLMEAVKEAELDSVKKEIAEIHEATKIDTSFDPANMMRENVEKAVEATPYETVNVELPAPHVEPVAVEVAHQDSPHQDSLHEDIPHQDIPHNAEKAASDAT